MSEFERTKENVGGRSVMMTSWYDDSRQVWRASAPAYAHIASVIENATTNCDTRQAAVARVRSLLIHHLEDV